MIQPFRFLMTSILMATIVSGWLVLLAQWMFVFQNEVVLRGAFRLFYLFGALLVGYAGLSIVTELISRRFSWSLMSHKMLGVSFVGGLIWSIWFACLIFLQTDIIAPLSSSIIGAVSGVVFLGVHFFTMYWWTIVVHEGVKVEEQMQGLLPIENKDLIKALFVATLPVLIIIILWGITWVTDTYPTHWGLDWRVVLIILMASMIRISQFLYRVSLKMRFLLVVGMIVITFALGGIGIESFRWSQVTLHHLRVHAICQEGVVYLSEPQVGEIALFLDTTLPFHIEKAPFDNYIRVKEVLGCNTVGDSIQKFSIQEVSNNPTEMISTEVPQDWSRFRSEKYRFSFAFPDSIEVVQDPELEEIPSIHTYFENDKISFSRVRLDREIDIQTYLRERKKLRCDYVRSNIAWSFFDRLQLLTQGCPQAVSENLAYRTIQSEGALAYVESGVYSTRLILEIRPQDNRPGGFLVLELLGYNDDDKFVAQFLNGIQFD